MINENSKFSTFQDPREPCIQLYQYVTKYTLKTMKNTLRDILIPTQQ